MRRAAFFGHDEIIIELLHHPKVDPTAKDNAALRFACEQGHHFVVQGKKSKKCLTM